MSTPEGPFQQLDYLYTPSEDVAADVRYFTEVLGGILTFAIDSMGARVAKIDMTGGPPDLLLTDHLEGDRPILVYRVSDLKASLKQLKKGGWKKGTNLEIPMGPCCSFVSPGGHRVALYELTRPGVADHFEGRKDF
jgi:hypothetical protein